MVTRSIESAQRKVEARNFDIRKQLLEYDDVANEPAQDDLRACATNCSSPRTFRRASRTCAPAW